MKRILSSLVLMLALTAGLHAQTATTQTTLAAAVDAVAGSITVATTSGITASSGTATNYVFVDGELMQVKAVTGTTNGTLTVARAINATRSNAHPSGSLVFFGPAGLSPFISQPVSLGSACTAANYQFLPLIDYSANAVYTCLNSRWATAGMTQESSYVQRNPKAGAYTALDGDYIIGFTSTSSVYTVTLPSPVGRQGKVYIVKNETSGATNTVWVTNSATIDGATSVAVFGAYAVGRYYSTGAAWFSW